MEHAETTISDCNASKTHVVFLMFDESQVLLGLGTTLHARIAGPRYHSTRSRAPKHQCKTRASRPKTRIATKSGIRHIDMPWLSVTCWRPSTQGKGNRATIFRTRSRLPIRISHAPTIPSPSRNCAPFSPFAVPYLHALCRCPSANIGMCVMVPGV